MKNQVEATISFKLKFKHLIKVANNVKVTSISLILLAQKEDFIMKMNQNQIMILVSIPKDRIRILN